MAATATPSAPFATADCRDFAHTGPGTLAGRYMRRFWQPIAMSSEVKDLPVAVRILGENLVMFRDKSGRIGLLEPWTVLVGLAVHAHGTHAESVARAVDPHRDLATVGDENFVEHRYAYSIISSGSPNSTG